MQSQPSIEQWIERLEGFSQGEGDGDHWMRVYGELIETLEAIVQDSRGESLRAFGCSRRSSAGTPTGNGSRSAKAATN